MFCIDPETIEYPEFRRFIVGIVERAGQPPILCYDRNAVVAYLAEEMGEDAEEYFEYNTLGTYAGPFTPCFIHFDQPVVAGSSGAAPHALGEGPDPGPVPDGDTGRDCEPGAEETGNELRP